MSKVEEEMTQHKQHKKFLDLIAIASKNKKPMNQKRRQYMKKLRQTDDNDDQSEPEQRGNMYNNYTQGKGARVNDATFLTQSQTVVNQSFNKQPKKSMGRAGGASNKQNSYATGKIVTIEDEQADQVRASGLSNAHGQPSFSDE